MATAYVRVGGSWVQSNRRGKARLAGVDIPFSPPDGPSYEVIAWPSPPDDSDNADGDQGYNMGVQFSVTATQSCAGVEWRVPDSLAAGVPGGSYGFSLWNASTSANLGREIWVPVAGTTQRGFFSAPVSLAPGQYIVAVYTRNYVYSTENASGYATPSGNVVSTGGRLALYNGGAATAPVPIDSTGLIFHVSPVMVV